MAKLMPSFSSMLILALTFTPFSALAISLSFVPAKEQ
jgi:hypothetical protein